MLNETIEILAECLEIEPQTIKAEDEFRELTEWDSLAYLSVIAAIDEEFGMVIPLEDFRQCRTVIQLATYIQNNKA